MASRPPVVSRTVDPDSKELHGHSSARRAWCALALRRAGRPTWTFSIAFTYESWSLSPNLVVSSAIEGCRMHYLNSKRSPEQEGRAIARTVVLAFVLVCGLGTVLADALVYRFTKNPAVIARLETG